MYQCSLCMSVMCVMSAVHGVCLNVCMCMLKCMRVWTWDVLSFTYHTPAGPRRILSFLYDMNVVNARPWMCEMCSPFFEFFQTRMHASHTLYFNSFVHSWEHILVFCLLICMRRNEWANIMMLNSHVDHFACLFSLFCVVLTSTLSYVSINKWTFILNRPEMLTQPASILWRRRRLTRLSQQVWQVSLWKRGSSSLSCLPCPLFSLWACCTHIGWSSLSSAYSSLSFFLSHAF